MVDGGGAEWSRRRSMVLPMGFFKVHIWRVLVMVLVSVLVLVLVLLLWDWGIARGVVGGSQKKKAETVKGRST